MKLTDHSGDQNLRTRIYVRLIVVLMKYQRGLNPIKIKNT